MVFLLISLLLNPRRTLHSRTTFSSHLMFMAIDHSSSEALVIANADLWENISLVSEDGGTSLNDATFIESYWKIS